MIDPNDEHWSEWIDRWPEEGDYPDGSIVHLEMAKPYSRLEVRPPAWAIEVSSTEFIFLYFNESHIWIYGHYRVPSARHRVRQIKLKIDQKEEAYA